MPLHHGGILDGGNWEDIKDIGVGSSKSVKWEPDWKPAARAQPSRRVRNRQLSFLRGRLRSAFWPKASVAHNQPLRPTAYLDGLRGFAAFLVYWHHHELWAHMATRQDGIFECAFGYNGEYHLATFPGIRNFFNGGHFAVAIFYVISGYVLSTKPLGFIHSGEQAKLADNLASALFRRWLRLYIPLICTTFVYMCTWHAFGGLWVDGTEPQSNWRDEVWNWYAELKNFSFVFNMGGPPWFSYNHHLWSIPLEFKGSIVTYTSLLALSRFSKNARLWCEAGLIFYFMYIADGYYCSLFVAGMFLCDLDLLAAKSELPKPIASLAAAKSFIFYHLFAISLYLGGVPSKTQVVAQDVADLRKQRGWYYLSFLKPQAVFDYKWFYLSWAGVFLVASVPRIPWLKKFFETRFCQYLGRVSYALYLVHGPVLSTLGDRLYTAVGYGKPPELEHLDAWVDRIPLPKAGPLGLEVAFLVPHLILLPVTFWLAEVVTRLVDEPSVKFPSWLYKNGLGRSQKA